MKFQRTQPQGHKKVVALQCDRCGTKYGSSSREFEEFASIDRKATGDSSIFGYASSVQLDLCQHCLKDTLGEWLRVEEASSGKKAYEAAMEEARKTGANIGPGGWVCTPLKGEAAEAIGVE